MDTFRGQIFLRAEIRSNYITEGNDTMKHNQLEDIVASLGSFLIQNYQSKFVFHKSTALFCILNAAISIAKRNV